MNKRIPAAVVVGIVMYALVIYLANIQRELTLPQLVLMLAAPFVVGLLSAGVKNGLILGFLISFIMLIAENVVLQASVFSDINVILAVLIMMALPFALISAGLGAVGGLVGKRVFKK